MPPLTATSAFRVERTRVVPHPHLWRSWDPLQVVVYLQSERVRVVVQVNAAETQKDREKWDGRCEVFSCGQAPWSSLALGHRSCLSPSRYHWFIYDAIDTVKIFGLTDWWQWHIKPSSYSFSMYSQTLFSSSWSWLTAPVLPGTRYRPWLSRPFSSTICMHASTTSGTYWNKNNILF